MRSAQYLVKRVDDGAITALCGGGRMSELTPAQGQPLPVKPLDLTFGAGMSSDLEQTAALAGSGAETRDQVQTLQRQMSAALTWKPLSAVSLEAG